MRVAVFISGGGSNMVQLVQDMHRNTHATPVLVLSNVPDAGGLAKAQAMNVPTATVDHRAHRTRTDFEAAIDAHLTTAKPDLICLAGFMRILTPEFTEKWEGRMINIHPSLLPKYKGLHTHERALDAGDDWHGCSVHHVTAALDDGPILGQARVRVCAGDTPETLATRVQTMEHKLYPAVLRALALGATTPIYMDDDA